MAKTSPVDLAIRMPPASQVSSLKTQKGDFASALHEEAATSNMAGAATDGSVGRARQNSESHRAPTRNHETPSSDTGTRANRTSSERGLEHRSARNTEPRDEAHQQENKIDRSSEETDPTKNIRTQSDDNPKSLGDDNLKSQDTPDADHDEKLGSYAPGAVGVTTILPEDENPAPIDVLRIHIQPTDNSQPEPDGVQSAEQDIGSGKPVKMEHPGATPIKVDMGQQATDPNSGAYQSEMIDEEALRNQTALHSKATAESGTATAPPTGEGNIQNNVSDKKAENAFIDFIRDPSQSRNFDMVAQPSNQAPAEQSFSQSIGPAVHHSTSPSDLVPQNVERIYHVPYTAIPIEIGLRALDGAREIALELSPRELGQMSVVISVSTQMPIQVSFVVEHQQTLALLMQDAVQIRNALEQAGFSTTDTSLQFSLRQDTPSHSNAQQHGSRKSSPRKDAAASGELSDTSIAAPLRGSIYFRQLDLSV